MSFASYKEEELEELTREIYHHRTRSPFEMTDEKWERVKAKFPGSVRVCREEALQILEDDE